MTPVMQTAFYDNSKPNEEQRGNCWSACIASLLDFSLDEVPDFVQIDVDGGENWFDHTLRYLAERGYALCNIIPSAPSEGPYIQTGISPRGDGELRHAVIYQDGALLHDPHPDKTGILTIESAYRVVSV